MWIKICANTNLDDAWLAAELGADALGFVFAPSKRNVTAAGVATFVSKLPEGVERIGVFTTQTAEEIVAIVREAGLTGVQLHGGVDLALVRRLRKDLGAAAPAVSETAPTGENSQIPQTTAIIQTIHWTVDGDAQSVDAFQGQLRQIAQEPAIDRVLVDSKSIQGTGGTGVPFDWSAAREALAEFPGKVIVAGGLRAENVAAAIAALDPWGVDVASGVEASPGRKDGERLRSFIQASRRAEP